MKFMTKKQSTNNDKARAVAAEIRANLGETQQVISDTISPAAPILQGLLASGQYAISGFVRSLTPSL
jgi:hypothetical protein